MTRIRANQYRLLLKIILLEKLSEQAVILTSKVKEVFCNCMGKFGMELDSKGTIKKK